MERKQTTRTRIVKPATTEKKPSGAKKVNPTFIDLQKKAESVINQYIDVLAKELKEPFWDNNTLASITVWKDVALSLHAMGLIDQYRIDLPEPELEPESGDPGPDPGTIVEEPTRLGPIVLKETNLPPLSDQD
jgi:hypothetical protein